MKKKVLSPLAQRLREERMQKRWSQQELADQLGTTMVTISRWENGASIPSPYFRLKLGQLFGPDFLNSTWIADQEIQPESTPEAITPPEPDATNQHEADTTSLQELPQLTEPVAEAEVLPVPKKSVLSRRQIVAWSLGGTATVLLGGGSWFIAQKFRSGNINRVLHSTSPVIKTQYVYTTAPFMNIAVDWSPHGHFLACAIGDKTVRVLNAATGNLLMVYRQHTGFVNDVTWSPDETWVASASGDKTIQVWNAITGVNQLTYRGHHASLFCVNWSHDSTRIASGGRDTTVQVWDAFTAKHLITYHGHTKGVWNVLWSPDDHMIASSGEDGTLQVWNSDTATRSNTFTYQGGKSRVNGTDWSPKGTQLVSSHVDGTVHIWDALTGSSILTYSGHTTSVIFVRWSPDGTAIASGDLNGDVHIWSPSTGKRFVLYKKQHEIYALTWAPDSRHIAIASQDGTLDVCRLNW